LSEEQNDDPKIDESAENAVEMQKADFTWERTATQDPSENPATKQTKSEIKAEKKDKKQNTKDQNSAAKLGADISSGDSTQDDAATLTENTEPFRLHDMSFTIGRNELVAVIGGVGSGKSSLLAALAGDMRKTKGDVIMGASRSFCPQYAWIQNATLKDNILFGKEYNKAWYVLISHCF
jgi:ABC-type transport system involved in cytochrome bd biosynthesis fused ATPase/permease subunit